MAEIPIPIVAISKGLPVDKTRSKLLSPKYLNFSIKIDTLLIIEIYYTGLINLASIFMLFSKAICIAVLVLFSCCICLSFQQRNNPLHKGSSETGHTECSHMHTVSKLEKIDICHISC